MTNSDIEAVVLEIDVAIAHLKTAQAMVSDARLALIRADRKLGPTELSGNILRHIKQLEILTKEHGDCAVFMKATLVLMRGDDTDVQIIEGR